MEQIIFTPVTDNRIYDMDKLINEYPYATHVFDNHVSSLDDITILVNSNGLKAMQFKTIKLHGMTFEFIVTDIYHDFNINEDDGMPEVLLVKVTNDISNEFIYAWVRYIVFDNFVNSDNLNIFNATYLRFIYPHNDDTTLYEFNHYVKPTIEKHTNVILTTNNDDGTYFKYHQIIISKSPLSYNHYNKYTDSRLYKYGINFIFKRDISCDCDCDYATYIRHYNTPCRVCEISSKYILSTIYGEIAPEIYFILTDEYKTKVLNPMNYTIDDFVKADDNRPSINIQLPIPNGVLKILNKLKIKIHY